MAQIEYIDVMHRFSEKKIQHVIIGGFAAIAHGVVRVTMDLDLVITLDRKDLLSAWEVLHELGFMIRQPIRKEEFIDPDKLISLAREKDAKAISFIHSKQPYLVVDLLIENQFQMADKDIVWLNLFGRKCPVASIEKLLKLKKMAGRPKDLEDIRELKKIKKGK